MPVCPECRNTRTWKDGFRNVQSTQIQRFLCRSCGYRFSENHFKECQTTISRQICVSEGESKNLVKVEPLENGLPGATKHAEIIGKLVNFSWMMKKQNFSPETVRTYSSSVKLLMKRGADLLDSESVKAVIAKQTWSPNRKRNVINAYSLFLKTLGLYWEKPKCKVTRKIPFIPLEKELDALIAGCGKKTSTFLRMLKETAMRSGEAKRILWAEVDSERRLITLNSPEKGSNPRSWRVTPELIGTLNALPKEGPKVFGPSLLSSMRTTFCKSRKRLAKKLQNSRLLLISFHTFRRWKATMLQHQTHDPWYVKDFLGHKSVRSTEIYITLERTLFEPSSDEFTVRVVKDPDDIQNLLEVGFEYVCKKDDLVFLRKRK